MFDYHLDYNINQSNEELKKIKQKLIIVLRSILCLLCQTSLHKVYVMKELNPVLTQEIKQNYLLDFRIGFEDSEIINEQNLAMTSMDVALGGHNLLLIIASY